MQLTTRPSSPPSRIPETIFVPSIPASHGKLPQVQVISADQREKLAARPWYRQVIYQLVLLVVVVLGVVTTYQVSSRATVQAATPFSAGATTARIMQVTMRVPTLIQLDPTIGYTTYDQYLAYKDAACGAASSSAVLLAWGIDHGTIGHVIEDMGDMLSPNYGIMGPDAFVRVGEHEHVHAIVTHSLTPAQIAQIVQVQGIPVVIGVRDTRGGYYSWWGPGHYIVVTGADANGFKVVDSSTYFSHYLTTADFTPLYRDGGSRTIIYYPDSFPFQMPA